MNYVTKFQVLSITCVFILNPTSFKIFTLDIIETWWTSG